MFLEGSRAIVLSSSFDKKTGPRRGSIGHVLPLFNVRDNSGYYYMVLNEVNFVRYGFEKKQRLETHYMLNMLPTLMLMSYKNLDPVSLVDTCLRGTKSYLVNKPKTRESLCNYLKANKASSTIIHMCIMAPIGCPYNNIHDDYNTLMAWLLCFLGPRNTSFVSSIVGDFKPKLGLSDGFTQILTDMHYNNQAYRSELVRDMMKNKEDIEDFIRNILKCIAAFYRDKRTLQYSYLSEISLTKLFNEITYNYYTQAGNNALAAAANHAGKTKSEIARCLLDIRSKFTHMAISLNKDTGGGKSLKA